MINLNHFKYYVDAVRLGGIGLAAKNNFVSSSAISQSILWLEDYYQMELVQHGKNKFKVTDRGIEVFKLASEFLEKAGEFDENLKALQNSKTVLKLSLQQSLANTFLPVAIKNLKKSNPEIDLKLRIGTTHTCKTLMEQGSVKHSISIDNVSFPGRSINIYSGKFVFISAKNDNRSVHEAGFVLTEDTKEVIELKSAYQKRFKKPLPLNYSISSWGVITNMAIKGHGIAYIPDYYLVGLPKSSYRIRNLDVSQAKYSINYYCTDDCALSEEHYKLIDEFKKQLK